MRRHGNSWGAALAVKAVAMAVVVQATTTAQAANGTPVELPAYPVCEASAAIEMPCIADRARTCIWIGDNEQPKHLWEYQLDDAGLLSRSVSWKISLHEEAGDIEALVKDGDDVLAIGSHGRNSRCEFKKKRARIVRISPDASQVTLVASDGDWQDNLADCEQWIALGDGDADAPARALRSEACAAILQAENAAEQFVAASKKKKKDAKKKDGDEQGDDAQAASDEKCPVTPLNLEGAVSVSDGGVQRIWVGLRAPVSGNKAFLLRLAPLGTTKSEQRIRFDGIAAIDLGGMGIRELTTADGKLWGIAGTPPDSEQPSFLWTTDASALTSGATITGVTKVGDPLPPTSEGLVIQPGAKRALVIIDGGLDEKNLRCDPPSQQMVVPLPG